MATVLSKWQLIFILKKISIQSLSKKKTNLLKNCNNFIVVTIFTNSFHSISALDSTPTKQFSDASEAVTGHLSVQVNHENCS
jgi:hypothetical protein